MPKLILSLYLAFALAGAGLANPLPTQQPTWLSQAMLLERQGDWRGLLDWGRWWTQAEPASPTAWFVLGRAYSALLRYPEAVAAYRENLRLAPNDAQAWNNLGNVYHRGLRYREAVFAYRDAVRADPGFFQAWQGLGLSFLGLKGVAGVAQALERLRSVEPELAAAWRKLLVDYGATRDPRLAGEAFVVLNGLDAARRERMFALLLADV